MKGKYARKVEGLDGVVDIVGTGGYGANTVNISTGASILVSACGAKVAKHGSHSSSLACGTADVLEALGVVLDLGPEVGTQNCQRVATVWHEKRALVVDSECLDEMSPLVKFGIPRCTLASLLVYNAKVLRDLLSVEDAFVSFLCLLSSPTECSMFLVVSKISYGHIYHWVNSSYGLQTDPWYIMKILNAAVALLVSSHVNSLAERVSLACETLLSGKALKTLDLWIQISKVRTLYNLDLS
ncbi:hypothetical protein Patl1_15466 [Pistacia atlantica]|uniref:Uncharacterized protein n=1 Tax=Pistacia atlantica TaxID=434234 RepID=A0ACC1B6Q9_9ROSI|nr:hypothetical protein Patl1_15466 [Pistacia atlantica]